MEKYDVNLIAQRKYEEMFKENKQLANFATQWNALKGAITDDSTWKVFIQKMDEQSAKNLFDFRKKLFGFIQQQCGYFFLSTSEVCGKVKSTTSCGSFGSSDLTSDIDITIQGECFFNNLVLMKVIHIALTNFFQGDEMFFEKGQFNLSKVFKFFDVNFYLSNFEVMDPYYNKTDYYGNIHKPKVENKKYPLHYFLLSKSNVQKQYAFQDAKNDIIGKQHEYANLIKDVNDKLKLIDEGKQTVEPHTIIDNITMIASYEDECYLTQGAFFDVVLRTQRKYQFIVDDGNDPDTIIRRIWFFMLACSFIENLKFALSHEGSRFKYIKRAHSALLEMRKWRDQIQPKEENDTFSVTVYDTAQEFFNDKSMFGNTSSLEDFIMTKDKELEAIKLKASNDNYNMTTSKTNANAFGKSFQMNEWITKIIQKDIIDDLKKPIVSDKIAGVFEFLRTVANATAGGKSKRNTSKQQGFIKLCDKDNRSVKKTINGRERVVYIDNKRCQYVKLDGEFKAVAKLRKTPVVKKTFSRKKSVPKT